MDLDRKDVSRLYMKMGLSCSEVAEKYGTSVWRVISFMRRNGITRRRPSETLKLKFERKPLTYNRKAKINDLEKNLLVSGLSLYWAEGSKASRFSVDFANSDEKALLVFIKVLRIIYRVRESKFRVFLYIHPTGNLNKIVNYWSKKLGIPKSQFSKPYVRRDFDPTKINKMPNGLVHIRYFDMKLLKQILSDIDIMVADFLD